jgi:hypothetical protein
MRRESSPIVSLDTVVIAKPGIAIQWTGSIRSSSLSIAATSGEPECASRQP